MPLAQLWFSPGCAIFGTEGGIIRRITEPSPHIFHMFGALAEFERSLIRDRTQAGLAAARRAGRPPKLTDDDIEAAKAMLTNPESASPKSRTASASHRRRSIDTSRPREPRIRRAFDNGRFTPKTARSRFQPGGGPRQCADNGHSAAALPPDTHKSCTVEAFNAGWFRARSRLAGMW